MITGDTGRVQSLRLVWPIKTDQILAMGFPTDLRSISLKCDLMSERYRGDFSIFDVNLLLVILVFDTNLFFLLQILNIQNPIAKSRPRPPCTPYLYARGNNLHFR